MKLSQFLCCPKCKKDLVWSKDFVRCRGCHSRFEIKKGIPILLDLDKLSFQNKKQIDYFTNSPDQVKKEYKLEEWHKSYLNRFRENFPNLKGKTVLDSATGQGYMAIELVRLGAGVIAYDLTIEWLIRLKKIARKMGLEEKIIFICCSAESLPIKNSGVDYLIANALLEHLEKEKEAISEINRICKKKAGLMITTPLKFRFLNPIIIPYSIIQDRVIGHLRRYDEKSLAKAFTSFKGTIKSVYYTGHLTKIIITKLFTERFGSDRLAEIGEKIDRRSENQKYGASNLCVFFQRR